MRDHSKHIELTREDAVAAMLAQCDFHPTVETVATGDARGRVLARDLFSLVTMPNVLSCRMDSVAVHWADFEDETPDTSAWTRGVQWEFANTGVAMPEGFDTAVAVERVEIGEDGSGVERVVFKAPPRECGEGTIEVGQMMGEGDLLVRGGCILTPLLLAHIAGGGHVTVPALAKPKVAFIPTGSELVPAMSAVPVGKGIESNSVLVDGKVEEWGGTPIMMGIVPDDPGKIRAAIEDAVSQADIVVINAGSSKGSDDWTMEVLEGLGTVLCHETNHGPGRHSSYSLVEGVPVVGISGPPAGAAFTTDFYLRPLMASYLGQPTEAPHVKATLASDFPKPPSMRGPGGPGGPGPGGPGPKRDKPLFGIKVLSVHQGADGSLVAVPIDARPGDMVMVDSANAYYPLEMGPQAVHPHAGDTIEVELRWPYRQER